MPTLGVFGGSFDPPHVAHVMAAAYALSAGAFERLLVVPVFAHAFDKRLESFEHRVKMCELAFEDLKRIEVSRIEAELARPSRTLNLLEALTRRYPGHELRLVIGADLLGEVRRWHRFDEVERLAPLFVIGRSGSSHSVPGVELPAVSSTHVRALFSQPGAAARAELELLVPRRALDYARAERLYAHSSSPDGSPLNGP
jgi:nicotinate-nucleotide adenylyltransferase